jgi:hypothetical protein
MRICLRELRRCQEATDNQVAEEKHEYRVVNLRSRKES